MTGLLHITEFTPVKKHHNVTFGQRWIHRDCLVHLPSRSPDLTYMDFFYDHLKSLVCETPFPSVDTPAARTYVAAGGYVTCQES
ncbi:hypothetical protein TNCV_3862411 [Trichonephila clavipes]|uniref:Uncharacterized protein n=1 Tax=Trichonephila clavipes TaxID=2585209 RepID=A0A8X6S768_TRICX|nr:hypothetical protein TNCV_3862411 [Trichonephila clavipes]